MMDELTSFVQENDVEIVALTLPKDKAVDVANILVENGVRAIWNFAPVHLQVPDSVTVQSENLAVSLTSLRVQMKDQNTELTINRVI